MYQKVGGCPEADGRGVDKLLSDLDNRLSFHDNRWMCLTQPERATLCLGPVARLEVTIVKARNIIPNEANGMQRFLAPPQPFVRVYLDDKEVYEGFRSSNTRNPTFHDKCEVDATAAKSIVRFHVYDKDIEDEEAKDVLKGNMTKFSVANGKSSSLRHSLGFVEICLADMPFDQEISGWLELRFPMHLQGTNRMRYQQHCESREDVLHERMIEKSKGHTSVNHSHKAAFVQTSKKAGKKQSGVSMMKSIMGRFRDQPSSSAGEGASEMSQLNAGELFVKMRLVRVAPSKYDVMYSHALQPPALSFNPVVQEDALPEFDIQELFDDAIDIKFAVIDDFVLCAASYVWYILNWHSRAVSGLITLCLLLACWRPYLINPFMYGIMAALLSIDEYPTGPEAAHDDLGAERTTDQ
ncbi:unnamed protein product [Prorocentrum cordatum]|uniref:C2 domain-containing protein n=1 Tax=Prorocentrum cordatum TaxID=2364126 RepID=A0ABN9Q0P9_9DINO|nr:unnamed protein product [Polarella glacialis]